MEIKNIPLPSISQVVMALGALSPFIGAGAGWFQTLPWQTQVAWVIGAAAIACVWLWGRARFMIQKLQNEANPVVNNAGGKK